MGYSSTDAQLLSVGPYVAACIFSILIGWLSDRYKKRAYLIIASAPLGIIGFFMLRFLPNDNPSAKYGALYLAATGLYSFLPLWLAWVCSPQTTKDAADIQGRKQLRHRHRPSLSVRHRFYHGISGWHLRPVDLSPFR